ncbi:hypothetical protein ADE_26890 [Achromobacter denitrificans]|uniref:hydrogenase n=1 Tax=Achromobacter denitrificans TaxID=32002 RepID=UPI00166C39A5|nr:hydrogenase [Achromobacter denitrificans]GFN26991.1 hypothetical protein ADE_26890 [Achromobacter denitrificans]
MPLLPIAVLTYTPATPGAASRLVDVGDALAEPAPGVHGAYRIRRLQPSAQLLAWARAGAHFDLSRNGAVRVWRGGTLLASERSSSRSSAGVAALDPQEIAYLEAYLVSKGRRWSDPAPARDNPSPSC